MCRNSQTKKYRCVGTVKLKIPLCRNSQTKNTAVQEQSSKNYRCVGTVSKSIRQIIERGGGEIGFDSTGTIYHTRDDHYNNYTTDAVFSLLNATDPSYTIIPRKLNDVYTCSLRCLHLFTSMLTPVHFDVYTCSLRSFVS